MLDFVDGAKEEAGLECKASLGFKRQLIWGFLWFAMTEEIEEIVC